MRTRGLSLSETIVSVVLLGMVIFFVLNLLPTSLVAIRNSGMVTTAENLAQNHLEAAQVVDFASLEVGKRQELPPVVVDTITYRPYLDVDTVPEGDVARLKKVEVTVGWSERGRAHGLSQWAYVSHLGR